LLAALDNVLTMPDTTTMLPVEEQMRVLMQGVEYGDPATHAAMEAELRERLATGKPLRVYAGFDPTAVDLHLGHLVPMLKMSQFQQLGHHVIFLIGTMTGTVGDPSDKNSARPMLTAEDVRANAQTWLRQAYRVLDRDKTEVRYNGDWLAPLNFADVVQLASNFTVQQFLGHETYKRRIEEGRPLYLHEFIYALMQGYDAYALETDVQIGGTEQLFNILAGRTVQNAHGQKPLVAVCLPILTGTDGKLRMSKSTGNYIGLDEPPSEMYGKVMSITDDLIPQYMSLIVHAPPEDIAATERGLKDRSVNPMDAKKRLARDIVALLYGDAGAQAAQEAFERVFQRRETSEDATPVPIASLEGTPVAGAQKVSLSLPRLVAKLGEVSMTEARRLVDQGAISVNGEAVRGTVVELGLNDVIRIGRHKFFKVVL
jgi:tyrosyl-tRNA synthetase